MLKIERLTLDDLMDEARNAGVASIADIEWAVLEADGKFSFLRAQPAPDPSV